MEKTIIMSLLFLMSGSNLICAQEKDAKVGRFFIAGNTGVFIAENENFHESYNDPYLFNVGGIIGLPVSRFGHVYAKASWIRGEAYYTVAHYSRNQETGEMKKDSTSRGNKYSREQSLLNIGFQRSIPITSGFSLFLNAGLSFTRYVDEEINPENSEPSRTEGEGFVGGFLGGGIEQKFFDDSFSVFAEAIYTNTNDLLTFFIGDQAGTSIMFGVRYYLPTPKNARSRQ